MELKFNTHAPTPPRLHFSELEYGKLYIMVGTPGALPEPESGRHSVVLVTGEDESTRAVADLTSGYVYASLHRSSEFIPVEADITLTYNPNA